MSANCFAVLRDGLLKSGFHLSHVNPCLLYKNYEIIIICVDDCVMFAKHHNKFKSIIKTLEENFKLTDEVDLSTYLGIDMAKNNNGS